MKKLAKLSCIVFIPLVLGLVLSIAGSGRVAYAGRLILSVGIPSTMFILVVVGLVLMITGRLGNDETTARNSDSYKEEKDVSDLTESSNNDLPAHGVHTGETEREYAQLQDINTSPRYESRLKQGEYISRHVANNYKNASGKEKVLGWLFFGFLMTDFALILVFIFLRLSIGIIICFSVFVGTILIALLVKVILEKTSMHGKIGKNAQTLRGEVKACLLSSASSVGGSRSATRITGVIYRVIIDANENQYTAYADEFYETGESVLIAANGRRACILGRPDSVENADDKADRVSDD